MSQAKLTHSGWSSVSSPTVTCLAIHPAAHQFHNGWVRSGLWGSLAMLMLPICGPLLSSKVLEEMQVYYSQMHTLKYNLVKPTLA